MSKKIAVVQLARLGDIISILPVCRELAQQGHKVDLYCHKDFAHVAEACSYVRVMAVGGNDADVGAIAILVRREGEHRYDEILVTQVNGNPVPPPQDGENFIVQQWIRAGMLDKFHDLPLVFDRRDAEGEAKAIENHLPPASRPYLLYSLSGHSSPFWQRHDKPDHSNLLFEKWLRETFCKRFQLIDIGELRLPRPHHLLGILEKGAVLVSIDSMPIHLAYATMTPTVVLSRPSPWYMSEPRAHWIAHETYPSAMTPEGRERIRAAIDGLSSGDTKPKMLIRSREKMKSRRVYHAYDHHIPNQPGDDRERILAAMRTWATTAAADRSWILSPFAIPEHATRTSETIGCRRKLPFIKDIIDRAAHRAIAEGHPDAIVVYTNSDIVLAEGAPEAVRAAMQSGPVAFTRRKDIPEIGRRPTMTELRSMPDHVGADLFAFRADFWLAHRDEIPDLLIGVEGWDFVARHWMLSKNPMAQTAPCIAHVQHPPAWAAPHSIQADPSQRYNRALCRKWAVDNGFADAIIPPGGARPFLFKPDGAIQVRKATIADQIDEFDPEEINGMVAKASAAAPERTLPEDRSNVTSGAKGHASASPGASAGKVVEVIGLLDDKAIGRVWFAGGKRADPTVAARDVAGGAAYGVLRVTEEAFRILDAKPDCTLADIDAAVRSGDALPGLHDLNAVVVSEPSPPPPAPAAAEKQGGNDRRGKKGRR